MLVSADLTFQVDVPAPAPRRGRWFLRSYLPIGRSTQPASCAGRVQAEGRDVTVRFDPMPSLAGGSARPLVRPLANRLDRLGLTVHIVGPDGPLLRLGTGACAPWWQRPATHGVRVQLVSLRALVRSLGGPRVFEAALPPAAVLPVVTNVQRSFRARLSVVARQAVRRGSGHRRR